ncbi:hypothetical protein KO02_09765 [Sphingobacterium sp. ML3W]|uniref:HYC_CC_PP family protein n=1 Tax=Sphingobacterium sp. ML3W TaxID=1538644 RepID=UPI0004F621D5|nr:hypothetical protein [Sphingobacterium sp. ML3W]AIM36946.1 hypothetical protein KO02_09765 [Sphingobacterium sp. ML3W]
MKKILVILLSMVYLVLSSGFTQYAHLCKGTAMMQISLTNINDNPNSPCAICVAKEKGLDKKKKDCCKIEAQVFKTDEAAKKQSSFKFSVKFWGDAIPNRTLGAVFDKGLLLTASNHNYYSSAKIPLFNRPLYILNCIYRI